MPLLNYTTKVNVFTTLGEIQAQLVTHGAKRIMQDYDEKGRIAALTFYSGLHRSLSGTGTKTRRKKEIHRSGQSGGVC